MLTGVFVPTVGVQAADTPALGSCRESTTGQIIQNITQEDCNKRGEVNEKEAWIWSSYYYNLAPLPEIGPTVDPTAGLGSYLNLMLKLFIGICAVLAVVMIIIGGLEYLTSELVSSKESGKDRITNAVLGLVLALGAYALLFTINPDLLKTDLTSLKDVKIVIELEPEEGILGTGPDKKTLTLRDGKQLIACDKNQIVSINLFGKNVEVNKGVVGSLQKIDTEWKKTSPQYKIDSIGGYDCRQVTGKPGFWSSHAFGLALDINPSKNPYGQDLKTDMPPSFIQLFTSNGWGWGGNWIAVKDAMHFSRFPPREGGNGVVES